MTVSAAFPAELDRFFRDRELERFLFERTFAFLDTVGEASAEVQKTQITFRTAVPGIRSAGFACLWIPDRFVHNRPPHSLGLSFGLGRRADAPEIVLAVEPYPGRWTHHVLLSSEADLTEGVQALLREAFAFSRDKTRRKTPKKER